MTTQPGIASGMTDQGRYDPDRLIAGEFPRICRIITLTGGVALPAGAVLGQITATESYQLSTAAASDGSQTPSAVLIEPADASQEDVQVHAYLTGELHAAELTLGAGHTLATITPILRQHSLFLR